MNTVHTPVNDRPTTACRPMADESEAAREPRTTVDGKQYIVVAITGGNCTGEYLAFVLPAGVAAN